MRWWEIDGEDPISVALADRRLGVVVYINWLATGAGKMTREQGSWTRGYGFATRKQRELYDRRRDPCP